MTNFIKTIMFMSMMQKPTISIIAIGAVIVPQSNKDVLGVE